MLVHFEGDDEFIEAISGIPENQLFQLGPASVQIRGGGNRLELELELRFIQSSL